LVIFFSAHRRQACLNEIQRLKVEGILDRQSVGIERGTLTVSDISVPLKPHYVNKLASDEINGHNLVCLLKYNEHVLATKSVPTMPGLKSVRFPDVLTLNEVFSDFKVCFLFFGAS
jgi:actin-binding protein anillin